MKTELDCQQVSRLISDGLDTTLPPQERARMRLHFVICKTCRDVDEQMAFLRRAMQQLGREDGDIARRPDPSAGPETPDESGKP